ncbi:MAG: hypothetical protein WD016_01225 [Balneolaceae bacterium]
MMREKKRRFIFGVMVTILTSFYISACDSSFEPLQENGQYHFSIFGALDHSADTQWVRVMPMMGTRFLETPTPIDARVTLTEKSSGNVIVLNDSLFQYSNNVYAWSFWTPEPINDNEEYTLTAEASDGRKSSATVTIPPDYPTPVVDYSETQEKGTIVGSGIERMVVAETKYLAQIMTDAGLSPESEVVISHLERVSYTSSGIFRFFPNDISIIANEFNVPGGSVVINNREVLVVSGSTEWPDFNDMSEEEVYLLEVNSNVENGLGVLAGIVSKRFPLKSCYDEEDELIACPLLQ